MREPGWFSTKGFTAPHSDAENHNISLENKCPTAEDNGAICMVMAVFATVSEELDRAEMGCHGKVIVLEKPTVASHANMNKALQIQGTLSENSDFYTKQGCEDIYHALFVYNFYICKQKYFPFLFHDFLKEEANSPFILTIINTVKNIWMWMYR